MSKAIENKEQVLERLNKKYGKGSLFSGNVEGGVKTVSTGSYKFDIATNCGGYPIGKLIEFMGPESSGKSTLSLHAIAEFQSLGEVAYIDAEHSFDSEYATAIGVDCKALTLSQPETMEEGYQIAEDLVKSGLYRLIVIDSHTSLVAKARLVGEIGDAKIAPEARLHSDALRRIKPLLDKNDCTVIGISQLRQDIGSMHGGAIGTGGNAWKFYPDMRVKIYRTLDRENETNKTIIEIVKNKCAKPFGKCEVPIAWGIGIDKKTELIDMSMEAGIIERAGSWYKDLVRGTSLGQGKTSIVALFEDNEEYYQLIKKEVEVWIKSKKS